MLLRIAHVTRYTFDAPVSYALQQLRLTPKSRQGQTVLTWTTSIEGGREEAVFTDQFNNQTQLISLLDGASELIVHAEGEVETTDQAGIVGQHAGWTPTWLYRRKTPLTAPGPNLRRLARSLGDDFDNAVARLHGLLALIEREVTYEGGHTDTSTTAEEALSAGHGVCQDHTHIFIACARLLGFPARYVSGYLMMTDRVHQDASHAWAEAYVEDLGWVGFDVSNAISPDEKYVAVATGLDYLDAAPVSGLSYGHGSQDLDVSVQVQQ
ncbi:transglutaminase family protein [Henriciella aquimarina]|uniref:transglutaminase family protein n=1 Tax=Henriciella aquimarina TaxID=545261 RepID=UPI0009FBD09A|nr:transglutaminase family protein [Henriciella aquimarina]